MYTLFDEKGLYKLFKWVDLTPCTSAYKNDHFDIFLDGKFLKTVHLTEWYEFVV